MIPEDFRGYRLNDVICQLHDKMKLSSSSIASIFNVTRNVIIGRKMRWVDSKLRNRNVDLNTVFSEQELTTFSRMTKTQGKRRTPTKRVATKPKQPKPHELIQAVKPSFTLDELFAAPEEAQVPVVTSRKVVEVLPGGIVVVQGVSIRMYGNEKLERVIKSDFDTAEGAPTILTNTFNYSYMAARYKNDVTSLINFDAHPVPFDERLNLECPVVIGCRVEDSKIYCCGGRLNSDLQKTRFCNYHSQYMTQRSSTTYRDFRPRV